MKSYSGKLTAEFDEENCPGSCEKAEELVQSGIPASVSEFVDVSKVGVDEKRVEAEVVVEEFPSDDIAVLSRVADGIESAVDSVSEISVVSEFDLTDGSGFSVASD